LPINCIHNEKVRIHGNGYVGLCQEESRKTSLKSGIFVCESTEVCDSCPLYVCKHTEISVEQDFNDIIRQPSVCGQEYPKLAMLLWVLDGDIKKTKSWKESIRSFFNGLRRK